MVVRHRCLLLVLTGALAAACAEERGGPCRSAWTDSVLDRDEDDNCSGEFEVVGHEPLGNRGMNSALAVAGDYVYVGSRTDGEYHEAGVAIVDVSDPTAPVAVGEIGPPDQGVLGIASRELRAVADKNLLIVANNVCYGEADCGIDYSKYPDTGGIAETTNIKFYDITDPVAPSHIGTFDLGYYTDFDLNRPPYNPHEFFLWRDPVNTDRMLLYISICCRTNEDTSFPNLWVVDISDPANPRRILAFSTFGGGIAPFPAVDMKDNLHSVSVSDDGRRVYLAHYRWGTFVLDASSIADDTAEPGLTFITPTTSGLSPSWAFATHSAVPVPGRDLLLLTDEVFPVGFDVGCPWGWGYLVDIADPTTPALLGEDKGLLRLPENDPDKCRSGQLDFATTYTAHNATVTRNLAFITWYHAGLQAFDISDARNPVETGAFYPPEPLESVDTEDPLVYGKPWALWSYPVIKDGLIYVVDIRNGLYIVRYTGDRADEIADVAFLEGNSNLGAFPPPGAPP